MLILSNFYSKFTIKLTYIEKLIFQSLKEFWPKNTMVQPQFYRFKMRLSQKNKDVERYPFLEPELENNEVQLYQSTLFNAGKRGRPLKDSFVIHEFHKLFQKFASKTDSTGVLQYKD